MKIWDPELANFTKQCLPGGLNEKSENRDIVEVVHSKTAPYLLENSLSGVSFCFVLSLRFCFCLVGILPVCSFDCLLFLVKEAVVLYGHY